MTLGLKWPKKAKNLEKSLKNYAREMSRAGIEPQTLHLRAPHSIH